jgi:glycosyltransferase involved in cell wall biosynthesis
MSGPPLVSIITPNLDKASFLEETIKSVVDQDYPRIEYIVVDGGSSDGSIDIIQKYGNKISRWISEPDRGQSHAINKGWRMAKGEIVAYINSDDLYFPGAVSKAVSRFLADPGLSVVYGQGVFLTGGGDFHSYFAGVERYDRFRLLNCSDFVLQPTTSIRRDALMEVGFLDESLHYCMDWDLWCRFAKKGYRFFYEPSVLAAARLYQDTKTLSGSRERLVEIRRLVNKYKESWWPHAYFGFLANHLHESVGQSNSAADKLWRIPAKYFLSALNYRNTYHRLCSSTSRDAGTYGVRFKGTAFGGCCLLERQARLVVPYYRPASRIELSLKRHAAIHGKELIFGKIKINGSYVKEIDIQRRGKPAFITLEIQPNDNYNHMIQVDFTFDYNRDRCRYPVQLNSFKLF